ncbi:MAG: LCP family protein [Patescibacteria group bacterium]
MNRYIDLDAPKPKKRSRRRRWLVGILVSLLLLGGGLFALSRTPFGQNLLAPVSFFAQLVKPVSLTEVDGRVNVLVLGVDTRSSGWSGLTDTILVGSISTLEGDPALVSIPRDFMVRIPSRVKINTVYSYGGTQKDGKFDIQKGLDSSKAKIEEVLGIKIPYWVVVNFEGFREVIDTLGGISVTVDSNYSSCSYPTSDYKYKCISFKAGTQTMNGEKALEFARYRNGSDDFDRARRQQKVITAVKDKIMSSNLLLDPGKLSNLYQQISAAVKTNASFGEIKRALEIGAKLGDLPQIKNLILDPDSGLVFHPKDSLYGIGYVIVPKEGETSYAKIQAAVRKLLFGSGADSTSEAQP